MSKTTDKHLKPQRGLGQAVSRQRRKNTDQVRRDRERRARIERDQARDMLRRAKQQTPEERRESLWKQHLLGATIDNQIAVMKSHGINVPVRTGINNHIDWMPHRNEIKAWTDHKSITMELPERMFPADSNDTARAIESIATIRGIFQHELGHIRFTVPFSDLPWDAIGDVPKSKLHWAWNCVEDQRMEQAVVQDVPRLGTYFTQMIVEHILGKGDNERAWLLLSGRTYLPRSVRKQSRDLFAQQYGTDKADLWDDLVAKYIGATTALEMAQAVLLCAGFIESLGEDMQNPQPSVDRHNYEHFDEGETQSGNDPSDSASDINNDDLNDEGDDDAEGDDGQSVDTTPVNADGYKETDDDGGTDNSTDTDSEGQVKGAGGNDAERVDKETFRDTLRDIAEQAMSEMRADAVNEQIVRDAHEARTSTGYLPLLVGNTTDMDADTQSTAETLAVGMTNALNDFVTASQPVWMSHQEHGVLDPLAYRTKSIGDLDYRRGLNGELNAGLDLHVSLLCDASVSMDGAPMKALSQVIYATSKACNDLGIGTTVTLWSSGSDNYRVDNPDKPVIYDTLGGTDPTDALDDLDYHNEEGASNHLVIIFTDGDWDRHFPGCHQWSRPDRHMVLVNYGQYYGADKGTRGCDEVLHIDRILNMPMEMTGAIAKILSK